MSERVLTFAHANLSRGRAVSRLHRPVDDYIPRLLDPAHLLYLPRDEAEADPSFKQLIPYLVIRHDGKVFHYQRRGGGEKRLARGSIGLGGHICSNDGVASSDAYMAGMRRELLEEVAITGAFTQRTAWGSSTTIEPRSDRSTWASCICSKRRAKK